jgi:hypothetical protein
VLWMMTDPSARLHIACEPGRSHGSARLVISPSWFCLYTCQRREARSRSSSSAMPPGQRTDAPRPLCAWTASVRSRLLQRFPQILISLEEDERAVRATGWLRYDDGSSLMNLKAATFPGTAVCNERAVCSTCRGQTLRIAGPVRPSVATCSRSPARWALAFASLSAPTSRIPLCKRRATRFNTSCTTLHRDM